MRIRPIQLEMSNRLIKDYRLAKNNVMDYFSYKPFESVEKRVIDLQNRSFKRQALCDILHKMNADWDAPAETIRQINRIKNENSVVVIGGQQAGLFTGPLYTMNKIISIIAYAKEQEEKLNVPVVPVFWIAGEDHDYDEINHIYTNRNGKLHKHISPQSLYLKQSISHVEIDKEKLFDWVQQAFKDLRETEHTKDLYEVIVSCLEKSTSLVDFFAQMIFNLFPNEGIVLIDSANQEIRELESEWFIQMIERQPQISKAVYETVQTLQQKGYQINLDVERDDAHIFYHDENNERILLKRENDYFVGKNEEVQLTKDKLIEIAKLNPERLSNNVVTRPMMQEMLFPTLAFFGGDGEINYWAALKSAFKALEDNLQLPPVVPRLSITYVTKRMEKLINKRVLDIEQLLNQGIEQEKTNWLIAQQHPPMDMLFKQVNQQIDEIHRPLRELAKEISDDVGNEAERNLTYIQKNITYLENKLTQKLTEKYERQLLQFEEVTDKYKPFGVLQERIWNPIHFLNEYGLDIFQSVGINAEGLSVDNNHYIFYLD